MFTDKTPTAAIFTPPHLLSFEKCNTTLISSGTIEKTHSICRNQRPEHTPTGGYIPPSRTPPKAMLSNTKIPPQSRQHTPSTFFALMIIVHPGSIQFTTFKIRVSIHPHNLLVSSKISIKSYKKPTRQCNSKNSHHTTVFNLPTTRAAFTKS